MAAQPSVSVIVIRSVDLEASEEFYGVLGIVFERHAHGTGPEHLAAELDGTVFEVYPSTAVTPQTRIGFRVSDVDEVVSRLSVAAGRIFREPHDSPWGRRAVVVDPDGHKVELTAA